MTNPPTQDPDERQWQQPSFSGEQPTPPVVSGQVIVPGEQLPPPSVAETTVTTLAGLVWPVMILLAIFTHLSLGSAIGIAIVASIVLSRVRRQFKAQRRAAIAPPPYRGPEDLR